MENNNRKKVVKVEKNNFFKNHPKLKLIAIGLVLLLGANLTASAIMMINSTLWNILGGKGPICDTLHTINMGLSKIIGMLFPNIKGIGLQRTIGEGIFRFNSDAGTYTFMGKDGALELYNTIGAQLTTAALGIAGIGKTIASKINKNKIISNDTIEENKEDDVNITQNNQQEILNSLIEDLLKSGMTREEAFKTITEASNMLDNIETTKENDIKTR